ncbi:unnamed protein product [Vitrella brassicaformis CCMP3155]|uniref:Uncharacterized protein n=1 Tax=Vitrella brassicaformis (strain CCMP3155) TaxID=1169540 RepID=A0A0G4GUJ7_VITBC|nr:unnamed protein product [Vitrella brassicaformis CCMP3155]|eukprot:CEM34448.1 unnamed protein product [Vitrella brassicaformis CCMP3155]
MSRTMGSVVWAAATIQGVVCILMLLAAIPTLRLSHTVAAVAGLRRSPGKVFMLLTSGLIGWAHFVLPMVVLPVVGLDLTLITATAGAALLFLLLDNCGFLPSVTIPQSPFRLVSVILVVVGLVMAVGGGKNPLAWLPYLIRGSLAVLLGGLMPIHAALHRVATSALGSPWLAGALSCMISLIVVASYRLVQQHQLASDWPAVLQLVGPLGVVVLVASWLHLPRKIGHGACACLHTWRAASSRVLSSRHTDGWGSARTISAGSRGQLSSSSWAAWHCWFISMAGGMHWWRPRGGRLGLCRSVDVAGIVTLSTILIWTTTTALQLKGKTVHHHHQQTQTSRWVPPPSPTPPAAADDATEQSPSSSTDSPAHEDTRRSSHASTVDTFDTCVETDRDRERETPTAVSKAVLCEELASESPPTFGGADGISLADLSGDEFQDDDDNVIIEELGRLAAEQAGRVSGRGGWRPGGVMLGLDEDAVSFKTAVMRHCG